jgi:hypothetical protein
MVVYELVSLETHPGGEVVPAVRVAHLEALLRAQQIVDFARLVDRLADPPDVEVVVAHR